MPRTAVSAPDSNKLVSRSAATACSSPLTPLHSAIPSSRIMSGSSPGSISFLGRIGSVKVNSLGDRAIGRTLETVPEHVGVEQAVPLHLDPPGDETRQDGGTQEL